MKTFEYIQGRYPDVLAKKLGEIWLAGGCFWGTEKYIKSILGVVHTWVGYANGNTENPTYEEVCTGTTNFAESVYVVYNPAELSLELLLEMYYKSIDPTVINRQGNDVGTQYRTGIYYTNKENLPIIERSIKILGEEINAPMAIEIEELKNFYLAEEYHQNYLEKNPQGYCHIPESLFETGKNADYYKRQTQEELEEKLTQIQFAVTQKGATEAPFQNAYDQHFEKGIYLDITTDQPLFISSDKYDSGCGWPAFSKPIEEKLIEELADNSYGHMRTEVRSKLGDSHLGHIFEDGPQDKGGLRYCINSASLKFIPYNEMEEKGYGQLMKLFKED